MSSTKDLQNEIARIWFYTQYRSQAELQTMIQDGYAWVGYTRVMGEITKILSLSIFQICVDAGQESFFARFGFGSHCESAEQLPADIFATYLYTKHQTAVPEIYATLYYMVETAKANL